MPDQPRPRITVSKDGPYLVRGLLPMTREEIVVDEQGESVAWRVTETFAERTSCALCRCGKSSTKPHCDGSHLSVCFDGTETADRALYDEVADVIEGPRVTLHDDVPLCAEARFCHAHGTVWERVLEDDDDAGAVVVEGSRLCPSGRYVAEVPDSGREEPDFEPSLALIEDPKKGVAGPLWVRGGVELESCDGRPYEVRNRVTLCRCGNSKNKPFCDGSHIKAGFTDE